MLLWGRKKQFYQECVAVAKELSGLPAQTELFCKSNQEILLTYLKDRPNITPRSAVLEMAVGEMSFYELLWEEVSSGKAGPVTQLNQMMQDKVPIWIKILVLFRIGEEAIKSNSQSELPLLFAEHFSDFRQLPLPTKTMGLVPIHEWVDLPSHENVGGLF